MAYCFASTAKSIGFNSMKVRLKPNAVVGVMDDSEFQFHEGPIKTQ